MSYNTEMQSNNAELQEILDAVNNLPDGDPTEATEADYQNALRDMGVDV